MDENDIINISNSMNRIRSLQSLHKNLLECIKVAHVPQQVPTKLEVNGETIEMQCFNYRAAATSRIVRASDGTLCIEYVFTVGADKNAIEVWRCHLDHHGQISEDIDGNVRVCDYNNPYISTQVGARLLKSALASNVFSPTPKLG